MRSALEAQLLYTAPRELLIAQPVSGPTEKMLGAFCSTSAGVRAETVKGGLYADGGALAAVTAFYSESGGSTMLDCWHPKLLCTVFAM